MPNFCKYPLLPRRSRCTTLWNYWPGWLPTVFCRLRLPYLAIKKPDNLVPDVAYFMPPRPIPAYDLAWLNTVLTNSALLPPGYEALPLAGGKDFKYLIPGSPAPIRVTTDPAFYEAHAESVELWSPGNPAFPPLS